MPHVSGMQDTNHYPMPRIWDLAGLHRPLEQDGRPREIGQGVSQAGINPINDNNLSSGHHQVTGME